MSWYVKLAHLPEAALALGRYPTRGSHEGRPARQHVRAARRPPWANVKSRRVVAQPATDRAESAGYLGSPGSRSRSEGAPMISRVTSGSGAMAAAIRGVDPSNSQREDLPSSGQTRGFALLRGNCDPAVTQRLPSKSGIVGFVFRNWSGARDLNPGPHGPEPHATPSSHGVFDRFEPETSAPWPAPRPEMIRFSRGSLQEVLHDR